MKKVSQPYKRPNHNGIWLRWFENGRKIRKSFPTKEIALAFRKEKFLELNSDIFSHKFTQPEILFSQVKEEYLKQFDLKGLSKESKAIAERAIERFEDIIKVKRMADINQRRVDRFIQSRIDAMGSNYSVNKDIARFKTFINWLVRRNYFFGKLDISLMKTKPVIRKALKDDEIRQILKACPSLAWIVRILFYLVTGLRKNDLESLCVSHINLESSEGDTTSIKTGKVYIDRPLPTALLPTLKKYIKSLDKNNPKLFQDKNVRKFWERIRNEAGLPTTCTIQKLRVTHNTILQKIGSVWAAQRSLEHSDKRVNEKFYTDLEALMFWKIQQLNPLVRKLLRK